MKPIALATAFLLAAPSIAQTHVPVVPAQFATAKTIFVGFEGGASSGVTNAEVFAEFQQALLREHRYTIVRTPAEADLSMRLGYAYSGFRLSVYDTKTNALLWIVDSGFSTTGFRANIPKRLAQSMDDLTGHLEELAGGHVPE